MVESTPRGMGLYPHLSFTSQRNLLFLLATVLIFVGLGLRSPWPPDEPRFVEVAREMVDSGQWLIPMRGGEYYPDKPPIYMWTVATAYQLVGNLKLAFLLPSALSGLLLLIMVYDLGCRLWQPTVGLKAAFLLLITPQFLIQVKSAQIDAMMAMFVTAGCYGLVRHFLLGPQWQLYYLSCIAMGVGILVKGVGFLPLLMLIPVAVLYRLKPDLYAGRWSWHTYVGPLLIVMPPAIWWVSILIFSPSTSELLLYKNNLLFHQTADRYMHSWHHIHPWYYFFVSVIPTFWFPLPLMLFACAMRSRRPFIDDEKLIVLVSWVCLVILFFSLSPGKRSVYLFPALPILCLAAAALWNKTGLPGWVERLLSGLMFLTLVLLAVLIVALYDDRIPLADYGILKENLLVALSIVLVTGCAVMWWMRCHDALIRFAVQCSVVWLVITVVCYPKFEKLNTPVDVFKKITTRMGEGGELALIDYKESFLLFSPIDTVNFGYFPSINAQEYAAWRWQQDAPQRFLLVYVGMNLSCYDTAKAVYVGNALRSGWMLLPYKARRAHCELEGEALHAYRVPRNLWKH